MSRGVLSVESKEAVCVVAELSSVCVCVCQSLCANCVYMCVPGKSSDLTVYCSQNKIL